MFEDADPSRVVARLREGGTAALADDDLVTALRCLRSVVATAEGLGLVVAAELRGRMQAEHESLVASRRGRRLTPAERQSQPADADEVDRFCAGEVAVALGMSQGAARDRVALACTLSRRHLATLAAMQRGEVGLPQARALAEAASPLSDELAHALEERLLPTARTGTPSQVAQRGRRLAMRLDARAAVRRAEAARHDRCVRAWGAEDGIGVLQVTGPAATIAAAYARIDAVARDAQDRARSSLAALAAAEGAAAGHDGPARAVPSPRTLVPTLDQLRADAALDLLAGSHDLAERESPLVQVHIDVAVPRGTMLGGDEPAEVAGLGPVTGEQARALAATATVHVSETGSCPHAAAGSRTAGPCGDHAPGPYRPGNRLARGVRARDVTCRFPGCRAAARRCDTDHTVPHPQGPTAECNLACLCRSHHRLKHRGGWRLEQLGGGVLRWTSPRGLVATTRPPDLGDAPSSPLPLEGHGPPPGADDPPDAPDDDPPWAHAA